MSTTIATAAATTTTCSPRAALSFPAALVRRLRIIAHGFKPLPRYIVVGEWQDPARRPGDAGRQHPYGLGTYAVRQEDGRMLIFPSAMSHIDYMFERAYD
jgi:hypothetical protein